VLAKLDGIVSLKKGEPVKLAAPTTALHVFDQNGKAYRRRGNLARSPGDATDAACRPQESCLELPRTQPPDVTLMPSGRRWRRSGGRCP
jgi:hypothetical protein